VKRYRDSIALFPLKQFLSLLAAASDFGSGAQTAFDLFEVC